MLHEAASHGATTLPRERDLTQGHQRFEPTDCERRNAEDRRFWAGEFLRTKGETTLDNKGRNAMVQSSRVVLGATDYGVGVDLWSAGCLLAEMFVGRPIMPGRTEVEQIHRIFKLCGSLAEDYWKIMRLPTSFRPPEHYKPSFQDSFKDMPSSSIALLTTLLSLNPRIVALP
ncbi:Probable serine/threonine-protein kinase At1g09600, partial [Linum perenne]